jgi:serine carboxypeptidase-like clade IV
MANAHFSLLFITISIFSLSCASIISNEDIIFPSIQAKNHIKSLNLQPKESSAIPSISHAGTESRDMKLEERQINLINGAASGKPAPSLGHHAGYYRLPHTHDAK